MSMRKNKKSLFLPHFCFHWGRPWGNHANGWKENSMLTNCLAACVHLTITVSEIERYIGRKSLFFSYPLAFDAPVRGVTVGVAPPHVVRKN